MQPDLSSPSSSRSHTRTSNDDRKTGTTPIVLDQAYDRRGSGLVPGPSHRLHAARLLAEILTFKEAAAFLGVDARLYRAAEIDPRKIDRNLIERASSGFGVSQQFLEFGVCASATDRQAAHIAVLVVDLETGPWPSTADVGARLASARRKAGMRNAREAVQRFGWKRGTYHSHEVGYREIYPDRLIIYAAKLEVDPREIAFGSTVFC